MRATTWSRSRRRAAVVAWSLAAALVGGCAGATPVEPPAAVVDRVDEVGGVPGAAIPATDALVVAYPYDPWTLVPHGTDDLAANDLAALWGLPLLRVDAAGQLEPALVDRLDVVDREAGEGRPARREVRLGLREGTWTDGRAVTADDVVATVRLQQALPATASSWGAVLDARVDGDDVLLDVEAGHGRWPWLLATLPSVLPAGVATTATLDAAVADAAVGPGSPAWPTGGAWTVAGVEPGLAVQLVAHEGSPLGVPATAALTVLTVPAYETALGLLDRGEVDLVVGHLALEPVDRATALEGVAAAAPLGGTVVELAWSSSGALGDDLATRARLARTVDVRAFVDGLLGDVGATLTGVDPLSEPAPPLPGPAAELTGVDLALAVPRGQEVMGFAARAVQRAVERGDGALSLAFVEPDAASRARPGPGTRAVEGDGRDGQLRVRRLPPWPDLRDAVALAGAVAEGAAALAVAHDLGRRVDGAVAQPLVDDGTLPTPLFRLGVAHAWADDVVGVAPSAWPGIGFVGAMRWGRSAEVPAPG